MSSVGDVLELGVVLALQRIGDRDRRDRNAGGVAGEHQQRVVDAVAGQDHHRPLGRQAAVDQRLGERIDGAARRLVGQALPGAAAVSLGKEYAAGLRLDGGTEQAREARLVGAEWRQGAHAEAAACLRLAGDRRVRKGDRPERRLVGPGGAGGFVHARGFLGLFPSSMLSGLAGAVTGTPLLAWRARRV